MSAKQVEWYLRKPDGSEYGPISISDLKRWAVQCRIVAGNGISCDGEEWIKVEDLPELEMEWIAHLPNGREYGPFNIAATRELLEHNIFALDTVLTHKASHKNVTVEQVLNEDDLFEDEAPVEEAKSGGDGELSEAARREEEALLAKSADQAQEPDAHDALEGEGNPVAESPESPESTESESAESPESAESADADDTVETKVLEEAVDIADLRAENSALQEKLVVLEQKQAELKSELSQLRDQQKESGADYEAGLEKLSTERDEALAKQNALEKKLVAVQRKLEAGASSHAAEVDELRAEIEAGEELRSALEDNIRVLEDAKQQAVKSVERDFVELQRQNSFMRKNTAELQNELDKMRYVAQRRLRFLLWIAGFGGVVLCVLMLLASRSCLKADRGDAGDSGEHESAEAVPGGDITESTAEAATDTEHTPAGEKRPADSQDSGSKPGGHLSAGWPDILIEGVKSLVSGNTCTLTFDEGVFSSFVTLSDRATRQLLKIAEILRPKASRYKIVVEGHTDDRPLRNTAVYSNNAALGLARAQIVEKLLVEKGHIPEKIVSAKSAKGNPAPYPNNSEGNRKRNRTVVIRLIQR
jgi:chemotaxis protein MotB